VILVVCFDYISRNFLQFQIDFVWVNRDQRSFEWFLTLLTQLEVEQAEIDLGKGEVGSNRVMDMHLFMTAAQKMTDMKGIVLQVALDLMHKKENKDLITGLKTKTQPGRPDWHKVVYFSYVEDEECFIQSTHFFVRHFHKWATTAQTSKPKVKTKTYFCP